jgi:solute carrier family 8 (sodium/calcium exchanger)
MSGDDTPVACKAASPICQYGGKGMFLPLFEEEANLLPGVRALIYGVLMVYFFVGVAIIADIFVASIEEITAAWKKRKGKDGVIRTTRVWNETVATLTLMALGSSAPEIFLAVIEVFKKGFHSAELGPSTIVGSASFNLLIIIAVCIMAIPAGEVRVIKELPAFYITAFFSLFAYVWLAFILQANTPDVVDIWEAVLTLLFLPLLVWISYKSDVGAFDCCLMRLGLVSAISADGEDDSVKESPSKMLHGRFKTEFQKEASEVRKGSKEIQEGDDNSEDGEHKHSRRPQRTVSEVERQVEKVKEKYAWLSFREPSITVQLNANEQEITIPVFLMGNRGGEVSCKYRGVRYTATPGVEFEDLEGELEFEDVPHAKVVEAFITLHVAGWTGNKKKSQLLIILEEAKGAEFRPETDGGSECSILTVTLSTEKHPSGLRAALGCFVDLDLLRLGFIDWVDQAVATFYAGGSKEEQSEAGLMDWVSHIVSLPWKLVFMFVPPPSFFGGWLCFFVSLGMIALLTGFVSDLAELFGCVLELGDVVTAVTFVALGTSMPDLFASLSAASEDETADAAVVNVTGSNSVNVFLGLGLPWSICAIYWNSVERTEGWTSCYPDIAATIDPKAMVFVVEGGSIGFSVLAFSIVCIMALALITLRRRWLKAELGGPTVPKVASAVQLVLLWVGWIGAVCWWVLRPDADPVERSAVGFGILSVEGCGMIVTIFLICLGQREVQALKDEEEQTKSTHEIDHDVDEETFKSEAMAAVEVDEPALLDLRDPTQSGKSEAAPEGWNRMPTEDDCETPPTPSESPKQSEKKKVTLQMRPADWLDAGMA